MPSVPSGIVSTPLVLGLIADAGDAATVRFLEFFAVQLPNPNTRTAYLRAVADFGRWAEGRGVGSLRTVTPFHVAAYVRERTAQQSPATAKQRLAALKRLFDWLVVGQVLPLNPAAAVRGPAHVVRRGKTPVLSTDEARQLLGSIRSDTVRGLRDRALIGVLVYSFARIGAAVAMNVEDVYPQGRRLWLRLHEKGGKRHDMPAHHTLEGYLDAYLAAGNLMAEPKGALFQTLERGVAGRPLSGRRLGRRDAFALVRRRARDAGITTQVNCHTFRATGITAYLEGGGQLEHARAMAAHASTKTTQLYDRRADRLTLDEIERIQI